MKSVYNGWVDVLCNKLLFLIGQMMWLKDNCHTHIVLYIYIYFESHCPIFFIEYTRNIFISLRGHSFKNNGSSPHNTII